MTTALADKGFVDVDGVRLDTAFVGPQPDVAPTLVLLHEGLGCIGLWGDFPARLAQATGCGVFVYARAGYGASDPVTLPRPLTYMHDEALRVTPRLLDVIGFREGALIGHSDGASIVAIHDSLRDPRVRAQVLIAPHFVVEDVSVAAIEQARDAWLHTDLRVKLARWHAHVDVAFRGWNDAWLDPAFRAWDITELFARGVAPSLVIQGADDQYGTPRQLDIARAAGGARVQTLLLPDVKHTPHREQPAITVAAIADFLRPLLGADNHLSAADRRMEK